MTLPHGSGAGGGFARLGDLLRDGGLVSDEQLAEAEERARQEGTRIGSALVELGHVGLDQVAEALARQHRVYACREIDLRSLSPSAAAVVPAAIARDLCALPVRVIGGQTLVVAMRDPEDEDAIASLWRSTGLRIKPLVGPEQRLRQAIELLYGPDAARRDAADAAAADPITLERPSTSAPVRARGTAPPRFASPSAPPPYIGGATMVRDETAVPRWLIAAIAIAVIAAGVAAVRWITTDPATELAPASFASARLGLRADIGPGWRRVLDGSEQRAVRGATLRSEQLVRGDVDAPREVLAVGHATGAVGSIDDWIDDLQRHGLALHQWRATDLRCRRNQDIADRGALCRGATTRGDVGYDVYAWLWPIADDTLALLVWAPQRAAGLADDEAIGIAQSVELL